MYFLLLILLCFRSIHYIVYNKPISILAFGLNNLDQELNGRQFEISKDIKRN